VIRNARGVVTDDENRSLANSPTCARTSPASRLRRATARIRPGCMTEWVLTPPRSWEAVVLQVQGALERFWPTPGASRIYGWRTLER